MGAFECPAVGSSVFSSPLVELITCREAHVSVGPCCGVGGGASHRASSLAPQQQLQVAAPRHGGPGSPGWDGRRLLLCCFAPSRPTTPSQSPSSFTAIPEPRHGRAEGLSPQRLPQPRRSLSTAMAAWSRRPHREAGPPRHRGTTKPSPPAQRKSGQQPGRGRRAAGGRADPRPPHRAAGPSSSDGTKHRQRERRSATRGDPGVQGTVPPGAKGRPGKGGGKQGSKPSPHPSDGGTARSQSRVLAAQHGRPALPRAPLPSARGCVPARTPRAGRLPGELPRAPRPAARQREHPTAPSHRAAARGRREVEDEKKQKNRKEEKNGGEKGEVGGNGAKGGGKKSGGKE